MDRSRLLKAAGVAVLPVLVSVLASTGNEVVLVNLLVILTGVIVMWKQKQERNLKPEKTNKNSYSCEVEVKKVLRGRTTFEKCGKVLHHDDLGLCKKHAVEFLASIILKYSLDTKSLLEGNDIKNFKKRSRNDGELKEFDVATRKIEENELQLKASPSSLNNSDTQTSSLESSSEKTPILMEVVTEASSKTESNVQTQPEVTYPQVPSTSKENEEDAASVPEKACSDCKELPDNSVPVTKNSKSTKNKHLDEKNVYSESREAQKKETLPNRKKKQSKGKNAYLDNSEVQKKENFLKMESKQPKELPAKLMLEAQLSGTEGSTGTTADNDKDWPKIGSIFNKNSTDFPILGSDSSCSFCFVKPDSVLQLYNMIRCEHKLCRSCTTACFSQLIIEADITDCVCPVCRKPEFHSQEDFFNYFKDFRKNFSYILDAGTRESLERKFKDYVENMNGDYGTRTKSYADAKPNERENCNQLQRTCLHNKTPGVAPFKLLCGDHSRCVDCLKEAISSENVLEFVCDICYKGNREAQLEVMHQDKGFNLGLKQAVGPDFYKIFTSCLDRRIEQKECASKFSSAISSRNSLNDYVEKRQTTCPNCRVHCDLTRLVSKWVKCHRCKASFCGTCKAFYNNGCPKTICFTKFFHLHHHEICFYKKDKFGIDKQKLILKANKVDFGDTEPESSVCLLREVYHCQSKPFRSDLCRYHYEDYLANLILQNNLKSTSNWY